MIDPPAMTVAKSFVVVSGLPGSGKSTLGRALARELDTTFIDKDDLLEELFRNHGCASERERHRLSRSSDRQLQEAALASKLPVVCSLWRAPSTTGTSGTPSDWLLSPEYRVVEVFCDCPAELAAARFLGRVRHPGHRDSSWSEKALLEQSRTLLPHLPVGLGSVLVVDTSGEVGVDEVAASVRSFLAN